MSFGFSPSDIILLTTIASKLCLNYRKSSSDFIRLTTDIEAFEIILRQAVDVTNAFSLSEHQQQTFGKLVTHSNSLLKDLNKFYKRYSSLASQHQRRRDKLRWPANDAEKFRTRITQEITIWNLHMSLITASISQQTLSELNALTHVEEPNHHFRTTSQDYNEPLELYEGDDTKEIDELLSRLYQPAQPVTLDSVFRDVKTEADISIGRNELVHGVRAQHPRLELNESKLESGSENETSATNVSPEQQKENLITKLSQHLGRSAPTFGEENSPFGETATATCKSISPEVNGPTDVTTDSSDQLTRPDSGKSSP
ncbi:hypothetical protein MMC13_004056 [Lambiella insularis]|nr:hypothetical protein [Lambiella insularis]